MIEADCFRFPAAGIALVAMVVVPTACASTIFPGPGSEAILAAGFHQVSGLVTVLDADSLMVTNFTYDGGGLDVYFYLGADNSPASFNSGLRIGPQLLGSVFNGAGPPILIDLPSGQTFEGYGAISVWCTVAKVSFASAGFSPVPEPGAMLITAVGSLCGLMRRKRSIRPRVS